MNEIPAGAIPEEQLQEQQSAPNQSQSVQSNAQPIPEGAIPEEEVPHGAIPEEDLGQHNDYESSGQQLATGLENAAAGASFGLSRGLESHLGIATPEEQEARNQANPGIAAASNIAGTVASSLVPGVGEGWLLSKGAAALLPIANELSTVAKVGRTALRTAIEMTGMQAGNEISDAFLGKGGSAPVVAGHLAGAGALGLLTGGVLGSGQAAIKAGQDANLGKYLDDFAIGLGAASKGELEGLVNSYKGMNVPVPKGIKHGMDFFNKTTDQITKKAADYIVDTVAGAAGAAAGSVAGAGGAVPAGIAAYKIAEKYLNPYAEKMAGKLATPVAKKVAVPIMLQAMKVGDAAGLSDVLSYGYKASKGADLIHRSVEALFKSGPDKGFDLLTKPEDDDKLDKYIEDGGIDQQIQELMNKPEAQPPQFAHGGPVPPKPVESDSALSRMYPEQNLMLNMARGRISNYLSALKPRQVMNKLPFDKEYQDMDQHRSYRNALHIANNPMKVLEKVSKGTVIPEDLRHFKSLYPELHDQVSQKITKKLISHQMDEERPSYRKLQSISMFLGTPLTSDMKASNIQAAQMALAPKGDPQQQEQQGKLKKGTKPLEKISKSYETADQARAARANKD